MLHRLTETDRRLALDERRFVQGGINLDEVEVSLEEGGAFSECDTVLLTMERDGMAPVPVRLDTMRVAVPASLMDVPGTLRFSLTGYVGDEVRATTERMRADKCGRVVPSGIIGGGPAPQDAAPDLWKQLMDEVSAATAGAEETLERAEGAAKRAEGAASDAAAASSSAADSESKASAEQAETDAETAGTAASNSASGAATSASQAATSARQAAASAQTASEKAASVLDHYIESATATTLDPGSEATATVADKVLRLGIPRGEAATVSVGSVTTGEPGTQAQVVDSGTPGAAVLDFTIPRGDPGDVSAVTAAEGSDISVSTDEGTVTIDDSALRARISELEQQTQNVVTGTSTGLVAHGEDAYAQKPREVRVKGKTWVNRWPVLSGTHNGITVATDGTGLVTVTGTATADADVTADVSGWATGKSYTTMISATPTGCSAYFEVQKTSGNTSINATTTGATLNVASDATNCVAGVRVTSGTTVNASFRVMLVDGTEAPDCFTPPASIASVETGKLVTAGKNLIIPYEFETLASNGITATKLDDGGYLLSGTASSETYFNVNFSTDEEIYGQSFPPNVMVTASMNSVSGVVLNGGFRKDYKGPVIPGAAFAAGDSVTSPKNTKVMFCFLVILSGTTLNNVTVYPQLELGSTATDYEPPTVTETALPEVELRSLPNGTCDELVIRADGTCEVERNVTEYEVQGTEVINFGEHSNGQKYAVVSNITSSSSSMLSDRYSCGQYGIIDKYAYVPNAKDLVINDSRFTDAGTAKSILASEKPKFVFEVAQTTEPQSPVALPALPAPTFNAYHDSQVPSDTTVEYARDINIVIDNLAKQIAGTAATVAINEATR